MPPYVYVSEKADGFSEPVYHCDRYCGSVEYLDKNDTLVRKLVWQLRLRRRIPGFKKLFRKCEKCCV